MSMTYKAKHIPTQFKQKRAEGVVETTWDNGESLTFTDEELRVFCPCADCRGHTPDQAKLIDGKQGVKITGIEAVGHYAVKISFSDDHDSGLYSWDMLYDLGVNKAAYWEKYLQDLEAAGKRRRPSVFMIKTV
ncbi:gamma-butyrobetaine hydroxylase-like domain-containing protein [Magnetofaba australis]|uniref:Gamma-butyrobetaine hydroxylase-like N-terminal domain-containing protein n=1 Tax=Magnetofaba australis IT-1 TaxID=1434232 RepID=A0A1Y2K4L6_9PROT|nr:DUF971 domain-containing protein [Magnetofaba australis]OSM04328.1 hypothetical protein MAIT1_04206 [Magnetofaba australis IT-1]